jgi:hypothetical protein
MKSPQKQISIGQLQREVELGERSQLVLQQQQMIEELQAKVDQLSSALDQMKRKDEQQETDHG